MTPVQIIQIILMVLQTFVAIKNRTPDEELSVGPVVLKLAQIIGLDLPPEDLVGLSAIVKEIHELVKK
jgi:hypothetical protein